jgi:hypothetical protein
MLLSLVVVYGALLRFDALTLTYGPVAHPGWLRALQQTRSAESVLRPDSFQWNRFEGRYISDPYTYLQYARGMEHFYAAHRREPVFPFATRIALVLLGDQDVAVSFASTMFSTLAIVATCLLGSYAFNYWVGLGAAAGLAIEYDVITRGVGGWRDDAFSFAVVVCAYAFVRFARTQSNAAAVLLGISCGIATLTRITALSFVIPGLLALLPGPRAALRFRAGGVAIAAVVTLALVGPFFYNCWQVFGDPFYSINVHADVYRAAEHAGGEKSPTVSNYLSAKVRHHPMEMLDTAILGLTWYPFANKWVGFNRWIPSAGTVLSWCSLAGLLLLPASRAGRLVFLVLATSLVPYAMTWKLIWDWRFTAHSYPFFLIAACLAVSQLIRALAPSRVRAAAADRSRLLKWASVWASAFAVVVIVTYVVTRWMPVLVAREALGNGEAVTIMAGGRDRGFFPTGWGPAIVDGNVTARISQNDTAIVWLPLHSDVDYQMSVRLDPSPSPVERSATAAPEIQVFLNRKFVSRLTLTWNPDRVGSYEFTVPRSLVKEGRNQLMFWLEPKAGEAPLAIRLWYVRVRPPGT